MPDSSASDGWIPLGDSAADITWTPRKVDESDDAITNMFCGESSGDCVPEWAEDDGVTTAQVPLAVNVTLKFQASGVRVFGSAERVTFTHPDVVVAIGFTVIDGKTNEGRAARFLEKRGNDAPKPAFVQENLDPNVQHTLFMDFANSPIATVSISNFEIFRGPGPTSTSSAGSGTTVESGNGVATTPVATPTPPVATPVQGTATSLIHSVDQHPGPGPSSSIESHSKSLPKGVIPAIVVPTAILALATMLGAFIFLRKRRRRPRPHRSLGEPDATDDPDRTRKLQSYTAWSKHPEDETTTSGSSQSDRDTEDASDIAALRTAMQRSGVSVWGILATLARERNETQESLPSYGP